MSLPPISGALYFFHHLRSKRLAAKAGMNRHHQEEIDVRQVRFNCFKWRRGIQRQAGAAPRSAYRAQGLHDVVLRFWFDVDGDGIRAASRKRGT